MHPKLEKQFRERAVALGNSGDPAVLPELVELTRSPVANVRRLAASAIGKLAGLADGNCAVAALQPLLRDGFPQVRQYAAKALSAYGTAAKGALADLRDMAISPVEKVWYRMKKREAGSSGVELSTFCRQLKLESDGKKYARAGEKKRLKR
jgi:HEAT repeat protein